MSSLVFPHTLSDGELGDALLDRQGIGANDCRNTLDLVALDLDTFAFRNLLDVLVGGDVDDLS